MKTRQKMERAAKKRYIVKVNHEQNFTSINDELQLALTMCLDHLQNLIPPKSCSSSLSSLKQQPPISSSNPRMIGIGRCLN